MVSSGDLGRIGWMDLTVPNPPGAVVAHFQPGEAAR